MLHINTHFFLRWIYGTRRSLTKLCVRHYIMKSFFFRCITAKILCWCLVCRFTINPNKKFQYLLFLIPIHFQNGAEILRVSIKEELGRVSGDKLFTEAQNVSGVLSKVVKISFFITLMILFLKFISDHFEQLYLE